MNWKVISSAVAAIAGIIALTAGAWTACIRFIDGRVSWRVDPLVCQMITVRRHVNSVDLYQWQHNSGHASQPTQEAIDDLKAKIAELNRQAQDWHCQ